MKSAFSVKSRPYLQTFLALMFFFLLAAPLHAATVFEDQFNDNSNDWDVIKDADATGDIKGGRYHMNLLAKDTAWVWYKRIPELSESGDFSIEASMWPLGGGSSGSYGLNWGREGG